MQYIEAAQSLQTNLKVLTNNSFSPIRFASNEALEDAAADYDAKYQEENVDSGKTVRYFNVHPVIPIDHISAASLLAVENYHY